MKKLFQAYYFANGEKIDSKNILAETLQKAREKAYSYKLAEICENIRVCESLTDTNGNVLTETLQKTALLIAKRSAEKSISRTGGNETQNRISDNLKKASAIILNYENVTADKNGLKIYTFTAYKESKDGDIQKVKTCDIIAENKRKAEEHKPNGNYDTFTIIKQTFTDKMTQALETLCPDSMEYYGQAQTALYQAIYDGLETDEQYRKAYLAINSYIMGLRSASEKECSTEYITENNGDIVSVGNYYGKILKGKAEYIPTEIATVTDGIEIEKALITAIKNSGLTPRQMQVILLSIRGYSQRKIADKMGVKSSGTIGKHFVYIREKIFTYLSEHNPEIAKKIK